MGVRLKFRLRNLFLGNNRISSRSAYKRLMLTAYMALLCMAVSLIYTIVDLLHNVYYALPGYVVLFTGSVLTIVLLRTAYYSAAKIIILIASNLVVCWAAIIDPFETGTFMFFLPAGIGSFTLLESHRLAMVLSAFTMLLFFVAYFGNLQPWETENLSDQYVHISFVLNYFISLTISVLSVYFLMNLNRISERDLMLKEQQAIKKNTELQKVNDELDRFVYSVSHDLRSPLSSILGLTNVARITQNREELIGIMDMIRGRVQAQDNFIRDIIDYARNTRTELAAEHVHINKLIDEIITSLKYNEHADKIVFTRKIAENAVLLTDRVRMNIILSNLISNAIKYYDPNKSESFVEIGLQPEIFCLYIKDNGIGIQEEHKAKIFQMFYRGSDRSSGSGLGLYIAREAAAKMNVTLDVETTFGEGSKFTLTFPPQAFGDKTKTT